MATAATSARRSAPGPRGHRLWGSLPELHRDMLGLYTQAQRTYGDVVRFRAFGSIEWLHITHPADIEYVLRKNAHNYPKGMTNTPMEVLLGMGLLTSEGDFWLRQRRLIQPSFHRKRLAAFGATMAAAAAAMAVEWQDTARSGAVCDVATEMMRLTLRIVGETLVSTNLDHDAALVGRVLPPILEFVNHRMMHVWRAPMWLPLPRQRQFRRLRSELDRMVYRLIAERRRNPQGFDDLLTMLMEIKDEDTGEQMSDLQLRDELMTLILAGHETTAVNLSWTWYLLARNPQAEERLHAELDSVLGGRPPSVADLPNLPYVRMVIDESMRLYPPAWTMARQATAADQIGGYDVPAGTVVSMSQFLTHRHPEFWPEPERFEPERFAPQHAAGRPAFAFFPFGGGARQCIGNNFALMESQIVLATLAQRLRLRMAPGHRVALEPLITLRPKYGMRMTISER